MNALVLVLLDITQIKIALVAKNVVRNLVHCVHIVLRMNVKYVKILISIQLQKIVLKNALLDIMLMKFNIYAENALIYILKIVILVMIHNV